MNEEIKNRLARLIDVKSIVTLVFTLVFAVLALTHQITADQFKDIFLIIISFYFGAQSQKQKKVGDNL